MERLDEQQLRTLAELPYGKKYASVRVAAEEELVRRSLNTKKTLVKFEHKYFISKSPTGTKIVKTSEWDQTVVGKYMMLCEYIEFGYDNQSNDLDRHYFNVTSGKCSWYSSQIGYFEKYYTEITEQEWGQWVEKYIKFLTTLYNLKDWE